MWIRVIFSLMALVCINEWNDPTCDDGDRINGYWWRNEIWIPGLVTYQTQFAEMPMHFIGKAVFYAPYIMDATAEYRGLSLVGYRGGVALASCAEIGSPVWLRRPAYDWEGPFLVVDCAQRDDMYGIVMARNESVEVDFDTALQWNMVQRKSAWTWTVSTWNIEDVEVSQLPPLCLDGWETSMPIQSWFDNIVTYSKWLDISTVLYEPPSTWRFDYQWKTFKTLHQCEIR